MCPTEIRLADGHAASAAPLAQGLSEKIAALLLTRSPLGLLVRWVAGIRASVHAKLLGAFMLVALSLKLAIGLGARADQADAQRCRDEQRDSGDNQRGCQNEHQLSALLEFFFEFAPEFGVE